MADGKEILGDVGYENAMIQARSLWHAEPGSEEERRLDALLDQIGDYDRRRAEKALSTGPASRKA